MTITLGSTTLPPGMRWADEYAWGADTSSTEYSVTGALIIQRATKQAGRPITLTGGASFAWVTKTYLEALKTDLMTYPDSGLTLTLHDGRSFTVIPTTNPLDVTPLPVVGDSGPANPSGSTLYALNSLKFVEI